MLRFHPMKFATIEGTKAFATRMIKTGVPPSVYRTLGRTQLTTSVVGFGCYRVDNQNPNHREALEKALSEGCNLIDTSTNYTDGMSESCVGETLEFLFSTKTLKREEVILVSKVGYVQGQNMDLARAREKSSAPFSEMVKYMEDCWHCIHPDFISDQLSRSLVRLKVDCLDVYLLHNPEYFFSDALHRKTSQSLSELRTEFYRRIESAFQQLESEVQAGRIRQYGISSNTFGSPVEDKKSTSVSRAWDIAHKIAGADHHFSIVQLPLNLFELGPYREHNTGTGNKQSALGFSQSQNMGVLVNRPLNAFSKNSLVRLTEPPSYPADTTLNEQVKRVAALETAFRTQLAPQIHSDASGFSADNLFRWADELTPDTVRRIAFEHWTELQNQVVEPQLSYYCRELDSFFSQSPTPYASWKSWLSRYIPEIERFLELIRNDRAHAVVTRIQPTKQKLAQWIPKEISTLPFSQQALSILIHTPGVSSVLVGMRKLDYVADTLAAARIPPYSPSPRLYGDLVDDPAPPTVQ